jgi:hypothetical protein
VDRSQRRGFRTVLKAIDVVGCLFSGVRSFDHWEGSWSSGKKVTDFVDSGADSGEC